MYAGAAGSVEGRFLFSDCVMELHHQSLCARNVLEVVEPALQCRIPVFDAESAIARRGRTGNGVNLLRGRNCRRSESLKENLARKTRSSE